MPYKIEKDTEACPVSKPWAVKNAKTGTVNGRCHETKKKAEDQARAIMASENKKGKKVKMEEFPQIVKAITGTPWLILPDSLSTIIEIVNSKLSGDAYSDEEIRMRLAEAKAQKEESGRENPNIEIGGGVGVISLSGPIFPKANLMTALSGATSLEQFQSDLNELAANEDVKQIVMDINSPGGASDLVHETGDLIRQVREIKPVYAVANTVAGSAALWLLSQATRAYATPSGKVGSLGVYTVHEDISAKDANAGRKVTIVSSGDYKTILSPHSPLSEEGRKYLQESVDETKQEFVEQVALGRNLSADYVEEHFGNAKLFSPKKATEIKMVDGVMSINDVLGQLVESNAQTGVTKAKTTLQSHVERVHSDEGGLQLHSIEHKEEEHAAPGTGSPPAPRKDESGENDPAIVGGWRGDRLPLDPNAPGAPTPHPPKPNTNVSGGESVLTDEQLMQLKEALGAPDLDDDAFVERATKVFSEHAELQKNISLSAENKSFAETHPQAYAEHMRLLKKDRKSEAKAFVSSISSFTRPVGDKKVETPFALSALAQDTLTDVHEKFACGNGSVAEFEAAIKAITDGGIVQMGEEGSARQKDPSPIDTSTKTGQQAARLQFADKVTEVQAQYAKDNPGKKLDIIEAAQMVAVEDPELAAAYQLTSTV